MQFRQVKYQPHTYIVENEDGKQLGTVDEFHKIGIVYYVGTRFAGRGMVEQKEFSGFTAALKFVGGRNK